MPAPCKPDHNGECLVCDAWPSDCAWTRLMNRDFKYQSEKELVELFYPYMSDEEKIKISLTMGKIFAPFSDEQVQKLKDYQDGITTFPVQIGDIKEIQVPGHPLTCNTPDYCPRKGLLEDRKLIPYKIGWTCPCGKYKQNWAYEFMAGDISDEKKES